MYKKILIASVMSFTGVNAQADMRADFNHLRERLAEVPNHVTSQVEAELYAEVLFKEALIHGIESAQEFSEQTNISELNPRGVQIFAAVATGLASLYLTNTVYRASGTLVNAITPNEQMTSFNQTAKNFKVDQIKNKALMAKANQRASASASPMSTANYRAIAARLNSRILQSKLDAIQHSSLRPGLAYSTGRLTRFLGRGALFIAGVSAAVTIVNHTVVIVGLPSDSADDILSSLKDDVREAEETLIQVESSRITDEDLNQFIAESN